MLLAGGIFGLALGAPAEERGVGGGRALVAETPLSPEAAAAVQSVLRTFRSPPPTPDQPILALALEVSRTADLVVDALAEARTGRNTRAREALAGHSRRIVELRRATAASTGPANGRRAETQAGPYLDELITALNRAVSEPQPSRRASQLAALMERVQSGELPVRQSYADSRSPMIRWFQEETESAVDAGISGQQTGVADVQTNGAGE